MTVAASTSTSNTVKVVVVLCYDHEEEGDEVTTIEITNDTITIHSLSLLFLSLFCLLKWFSMNTTDETPPKVRLRKKDEAPL
mmetsp:Transcript_10335/g.8631  ORF Transcript_10335/g.8631 Transcript_10335/m.8631 type:complete len:82 (+) Transcript_10335:244-489(+)